MQQVDIDVSLEGDARKVSRRAASIVLHADGAFSLRCLGRRSVSVSPYPCHWAARGELMVQAELQTTRLSTFDPRCAPFLQVRVNGREILPGSSAPLPHLSLLEAGRVRLLFAVNPGAVRRIVRRSRAITLEA